MATDGGTLSNANCVNRYMGDVYMPRGDWHMILIGLTVCRSDFADEFPSAEVIGTDLSPIQPSWVPPNLKL